MAEVAILSRATLAAVFGAIFAAGAQAQSPPQDAPSVRLAAAPAADTGPGAAGATDATALAKKLQNPIGDLYSFPFQSNTNFNYGPHKGTQEILNIQPVIPVHVNEDWNVITRAILPLIWQPSLQPAQTVPFGTGPITFSAFLSPSRPVNGWLWGIGPVIQAPTISSATLGSNLWGGGPTGVVVYMGGPWVAGLLVNNVWSFGGTAGRGGTRYNNFLAQPFVNYNFNGGWYVGTSPVIIANWLTAGDKAWTLPVGAQVGRVVKIGGKLPINVSLGAYYNALRPEFGSTWQMRTQITVLF
ncbi:MAG: neuromedin U [Terriglobales bacterium]